MRSIRYAAVLIVGLLFGFTLGFITSVVLYQKDRQGVTLQEDVVIYNGRDAIAQIKKGATFNASRGTGQSELRFFLDESKVEVHPPVETYYSDKPTGTMDNGSSGRQY